MKVAVTGANGFIGKHLVKALKGRGDEIIEIPRLVRSDTKELDKINVDEIYHLSAYGNHYGQNNLHTMFLENVQYTLNLIIHPTYKKFYNFSTSSVTLKKQTNYSASKIWSETIANNFLGVVNIRPYSVYGEGEADHRFIPTVIRHLYSGEEMKLDQTAVHDWIHVEDFIKALFAGHTEIGTGEQHSNIEIVAMLEEISGKKLNDKPGVLREYDTTNWVCPKGVPHMSIYEGLKRTYESIRAKNT